MTDVCAKCALPKALCVCETIAKEEQRITVKLVKKKFGKLTTVIEGIDEKSIDLKELTKKLKSKLACGGTAKEGKIELQGSHITRVKEYLEELGYPAQSITIIMFGANKLARERT
ncbi:translation initiation factor [archaeon]|nr:translation initiation factor [archaeon]